MAGVSPHKHSPVLKEIKSLYDIPFAILAAPRGQIPFKDGHCPNVVDFTDLSSLFPHMWQKAKP